MDMLQKLNENGYITEDTNLSQILQTFKITGEKNNISAILLEGAAGSGKTYLAEIFASIVGANLVHLQCDTSIKDILLDILINNINSPTVIILDINKNTAKLNSFLLNFLNSKRITNETKEWTGSNFSIWFFIISQDERNFSKELLNKYPKIHLDKPSREIFIKSMKKYMI